MSGSLLCLLLLCLYVGSVSCETKCYRDQGLGDAEGNVYYCYGDDRPECCEQNSQFTCCETQGSKTAREQAQLWGTVAAVVIIIGLIFVCCKNDISFCNSDDRTLADRLGLSNRQAPVVPRLSRPGERTSFKDRHRYPYTSLPPLPPMTPYPERPGTNLSQSDELYPSLQGKAGYAGARSNAGFLGDEEDIYRY